MKTKSTFTFLMLSVFCLSLSIESLAQNAKESEVNFITKMSCAGCKKGVETRLSTAPGVIEYIVDLPTKEVWVKYDTGKTNKATLIETIGKAAEEIVLAEVTFVTKIDCSGCQKTVETALSAAPGVKEYKVDLPTKEVWVKYVANVTDKAAIAECMDKYAPTEKQ